MELTPERFHCDAAETVRRLEEYLRLHLERMNRKGAAVGISGGVDSSAVAALCVRALGRERVRGLILKERQGNPEARRYARMIADHLGIRTETIDVTPSLRAMGVYRFITSLVPSRRLAGWMVRRYMDSYDGNPYLEHKKGADVPLIHRGFASINTKHRVRLVYAYRWVEKHNFMLVGCGHQSEAFLGLYVKYGIDDCADLMPFGGMYRSQVLQLADYLGVPQEIVDRPPSPDVLAGINDKYRDVFGLDSQTADLVLLGLAEGMSTAEITRQTGAEPGTVEEIAEVRERTYHMRHHSIIPDLPPEVLFDRH